MSAHQMDAPPVEALSERRRRFERLYTAEHGRVLGYAMRRTERPEDAADVIAEVFVIAWRRLDQVPEGDETRLWLYGTARRVLANHRRGERRRYALAERLRAELDVHGPASEPEGDLATVLAAFRRLPEGDREVLALKGWEGLDPTGIAAVLGCSRNAARIRLHRARRRLRQQLAMPKQEGPAGVRAMIEGEAT